jgi:Xaa-Pro aminopeptidase
MWDFVSVGPDPWGGDGVVMPGAIIKADVGTVIGGYSSDGARTFVFGKPDPMAEAVYNVLAEAFAAGLATLRPGALLSDVYAATASVIRRSLPDYQRGHFGHSVGASVGSEEWPFIAADSHIPIEPGMVLAFETPFYGNGIGALMIEDQVLVTETGIEVMNTLPRDLVRIG